jgi:hypothetical protein
MKMPKIFSNVAVQMILATVLVVIAIYFIAKKTETFAPFVSQEAEPESEPEIATPESMMMKEIGATVDYSNSTNTPIKPEELLPQAPEAPEGVSGDLSGQNFVFTSGFGLGINTVGSSMRNANLQLRSEPANPVVQVSPWMQSTITPDFSRKSFEIGN